MSESRRRDKAFRTPRWIVRALARRNPDTLFFVSTHEKKIALTIDDSPHSTVTPEILRVLEDYEAQATFFIIGSHAKEQPHLLADIAGRGHELANHLYTDRASWRLNPREFVGELEATDALIRPFGPVRWCRPGSGALNQRMVEAMLERNYRPCLASDYPLDAHFTTEMARRQFMANVAPGAILVLHDGYEKRRKTVRILEAVLPRVRSLGYSVLTVSELVDQSKVEQ